MPETGVNFDSYKAVAQSLFRLNKVYGDMPIDAVWEAFEAAGGYGHLINYPMIQSRRVQAINTLPEDYTKDKIAKMVNKPGDHERELRAVSSTLAANTKTYDLILQTFQDMMTYDWYIYPGYSPREIDIETKKRDMHLCERIVKSIDPKSRGHEIVGKCAQFGKVFYTPRIAVDKSHSTVHYAFLQQLPEDWCKIVGYNNGPGKYTIAFNLMYFEQEGTDWRQFGNLFQPYMQAFSDVVITRGKYVYQSKKPRVQIDTEKFKQLGIAQTAGNPKWALIGNVYYYWVTLPADAVITFELVDRNDYIVPPNTGMFVSLSDLPNYEAAQMEIVLNPLTSVMSGELETYDTKGVPNADPIAVSPSMRKLFETYWYEMLAQNNTSGIGLYLAPARNLKLQTLSDTVSNTNIATTAVSDQIQKAGLASIIPTTDEPKVGVAELSALINSRYAMPIYWTFEKMFNNIFEELGIRTPVKFRMFGDIFTREKELENARKGMTLGILTDTLKYDAMQGHTLLDDIATSDFLYESGVLDKRIPLVSTYSANQTDSGLPPEGGRPPEDGSANSQKTEQDRFE